MTHTANAIKIIPCYNGNGDGRVIAKIENPSFKSRGVDHYTNPLGTYVHGWRGKGYKNSTEAIAAAKRIISAHA